MPEYKAGHAVTVVKPGCTYSNYTAVFYAARFKNKEYNSPFAKGTTATITGVYYHPETGIKLYALEQDGKECIVDEGAIKPWNEADDLYTFAKEGEYKYVINSHGGPLMVGQGLVPGTLAGKCLIVDMDHWTMDVREDLENNIKILTFKPLN